MECPATDSADVENVATPPALRPPVPIAVAPSRKVTVPPGVPPGPETFAVKVTAWPNVEGLTLEERAVVDAAFWTVRTTGPTVLPVKLVSPV
jgi:hypothetical protein